MAAIRVAQISRTWSAESVPRSLYIAKKAMPTVGRVAM
jgi:hypothetical protein